MTAPLRFAVIGSPVGHSKSPVMHAAAFRALGLPHVYEKIETSEAELPARIEALRRGDVAGLNVTVPHKARVLALVDETDASAAAVGAANTLVRVDGRVRAHNTDAPALAAELDALARGAVRGRPGLVLGSGGAARAAVAALGMLGASRIELRARAAEDPARAADLASEMERVLTEVTGAPPPVLVRPLVAPPSEAADLAAIVQTTTCGMSGGPPGEIVADAVAWRSAPDHAIVVDAVYAPRVTRLLDRARARGLAAEDGLGMLARQGALALSLWLGVPAPLDAMRAAIEGAT